MKENPLNSLNGNLLNLKCKIRTILNNMLNKTNILWLITLNNTNINLNIRNNMLKNLNTTIIKSNLKITDLNHKIININRIKNKMDSQMYLEEINNNNKLLLINPLTKTTQIFSMNRNKGLL
jgi:hypothetical protein